MMHLGNKAVDRFGWVEPNLLLKNIEKIWKLAIKNSHLNQG